jgi:N-acetyl-gamma-glutamyl-phosphate reductase
MERIQVGVYGGTGYTGLELIRLLVEHPQVKLCFVTSEANAGASLCQSQAQAPDIPLVPAAAAPLEEVDQVFLCLPHSESGALAARAAAAGRRVVDLSADLRLDDPQVYRAWYHKDHPAPELLPVPYGLPELGREKIIQARLVANPGCYATSVLLGLAPLVEAGWLAPGQPIIVDAKSGVTGAGRAPKQHILFAEVSGNLSPYSIGRAHRHVPEIEQELGRLGCEPGRLVFSPHLLPVARGILSAIYVQGKGSTTALRYFEDWYRHEQFVDVLRDGELATLAHVTHTPRAVISLTPVSEDLLIVMVALDNLLKGAASQAIQNFNLMWGLPEACGLLPEKEW